MYFIPYVIEESEIIIKLPLLTLIGGIIMFHSGQMNWIWKRKRSMKRVLLLQKMNRLTIQSGQHYKRQEHILVFHKNSYLFSRVSISQIFPKQNVE